MTRRFAVEGLTKAQENVAKIVEGLRSAEAVKEQFDSMGPSIVLTFYAHAGSINPLVLLASLLDAHPELPKLVAAGRAKNVVITNEDGIGFIVVGGYLNAKHLDAMYLRARQIDKVAHLGSFAPPQANIVRTPNGYTEAGTRQGQVLAAAKPWWRFW